MQFAFGAAIFLRRHVMRHIYKHSGVGLALLFLFADSAFAQSIKPTAKPVPLASPTPAMQTKALSPAAAASSGRDDKYQDYKFRVLYGGSLVAGFADYKEIGNAQRKLGGSGRSEGGEVPVTVPGSLVGSPDSVTLNCVPSRGNGREGAGKTLPGDAWTINLTCPIPYDMVTLQRGVTHDPDFANWLSAVQSGKMRDLSVEAVDEIGRGSRAHLLKGCTVASSQMLPALDSRAHSTNIADLELHCSAVER